MIRDVSSATLVARALTERGHQERLDRLGSPCACGSGQRLCLGHYGLLDAPSRARARRAVGIRDFEGRRY
jgi:hypothetical protein